MTTNTMQTAPHRDNAPQSVEETDHRLIHPPVDIFEGDDAFLLVADMPGMDPEGIDVRLERDTLHVEGKSDLEVFEPLHFKRAFRVLRGLDPAAITASYKLGVLTVRLPKPDSIRPRTIQVVAG